MDDLDASDILAIALREMDDIVKSNDIQHAPSPRPMYSRSGRISSPGPLNFPASNSAGCLSERGSTMEAARNAAQLVERLRATCSAEGLDLQEIARLIPGDSSLFLRQFATDMDSRAVTPGTTSSTSSLVSSRPALHHSSMPEDDRRSMENLVSVLQEQLEAQRERIKELETANGGLSHPTELSPDLKLNLMTDNSRLQLRINMLEANNRELNQILDTTKVENGNLKLNIMKLEGELLNLKKLHQTREQPNGISSEEVPAATSTPISGGHQHGKMSQNNGPEYIINPGCKSTSMGELRDRQIPSTPSYPPMTPPTRLKDYLHPTGSFILDRRPKQDDDLISNEGKTTDKFVKFKELIDKKFRRRPGSEDCDPFMLPSTQPQFQRGGTRATAGPRLGLLNSKEARPDDFAHWDCDQVCVWLHQLGLGMYIVNCRQWLRHGSQLLQATKKDIEKQLGIRHPLHVKKILVHLRAMRYGLPDLLSTTISFSVPKWLDDIGLLQYLSSFQTAAVDMKVIDSLTMDDLASLKVSNELHVLSLRRGIQLLRALQFDLNRLRRRPTETSDHPVPLEVCLWSHHQVVEWLRKIELPEYASNLRGSGLHGALMILEDRFTADVFAAVLNIPSSKSLLRRHLSSHFQTLIGPQIAQRKTSAAQTQQPLLIHSKIKTHKKRYGVFSRKSHKDIEVEEPVCPKDLASSIVDFKKLSSSADVIETDIDDLGQNKMSLIQYEKAPSTNV